MDEALFGYAEAVAYDIERSFRVKPDLLTRCPMCFESIERIKLPLGDKESDNFSFSANAALKVLPGFSYVVAESYDCLTCGWWGYREDLTEMEFYSSYDILLCGVLKEWEVSSKTLPMSALRDYIQSKGERAFRLVDPIVFERLVADCLKSEYAPCEVRHVGVRGGRGDGGIDLYLVKEEEEWLIQVKRRVADRPEGIDTVRLLNGVLLREGRTRGMVITSSLSYTRGAQREAEPKVAGTYRVDLLDSGDVMRMLAKLPRGRMLAYRSALRDERLWNSCETMSPDLASLFSGGTLSDELT